jgi:hypothetical protein
MAPITLQRLALAGGAWGIVAYLLGGRAIGPTIWGAVLASPLIAVAVGRITQDRFENATGWRRPAIALGSLYVGATIFALTTVIFSLASPGRLELLGGMLAGVLWGTTLFSPLLWPLAYLTHALVAYDPGA